MFQMAGPGPSLAQAGYFLNRAPEPVPHAVERSISEAERIYGVVDRQLAESEFLAGDYSIADIACYLEQAILASVASERRSVS